MAMIFAVWVILAFSISTGTYADTIVSDKEQGLGMYFHTIGIKPLVYWISNLISDLFIFAISAMLFLSLVFPLKLEVIEHKFWLIAILTLAFGLSLVTFTYLISMLFKRSSAANKLIPIAYIVLGYFTPVILKWAIFAKWGCTAFHIAEGVFMFIPILPYWYSLYDIMWDAFPLAHMAKTMFAKDPTTEESEATCDSISLSSYQYVLIMIITGIISLIFAYSIDKGKMNAPLRADNRTINQPVDGLPREVKEEETRV